MRTYDHYILFMGFHLGSTSLGAVNGHTIHPLQAALVGYRDTEATEKDDFNNWQYQGHAAWFAHLAKGKTFRFFLVDRDPKAEPYFPAKNWFRLGIGFWAPYKSPAITKLVARWPPSSTLR